MWYFFPFTHSWFYISQDPQQPHILKLHPPVLVQQATIVNSTHLTFCFLLFISFFNTLSLSLSLSLFVVNMCSARRKSRKNKPQLKQTGKTQDARAAKNKPQLKQTNHYKSAYLWASLILSQHNIINLIFFSFFLLSKR